MLRGLPKIGKAKTDFTKRKLKEEHSSHLQKYAEQLKHGRFDDIPSLELPKNVDGDWYWFRVNPNVKREDLRPNKHWPFNVEQALNDDDYYDELQTAVNDVRYSLRWKVQARKRLTEVNHLRLDLKLMSQELDDEQMLEELHQAVRSMNTAITDSALDAITRQIDEKKFGPLLLQGQSIIALWKWLTDKSPDPIVSILKRRDPLLHSNWLKRVEKFFAEILRQTDSIDATVYDAQLGTTKWWEHEAIRLTKKFLRGNNHTFEKPGVFEYDE